MAEINVVIYIAVACAVIGGFLRGMRKGLYKSLIDLGVAVITMILSIFFAKLISKALVNEESIVKMLDFFMENSPDLTENLMPIKETIVGLSADTDTIGMAMTLPVIILTPIVYIIVHCLVSLVLSIPKFIIARSLFGKNSGATYKGGNRPFGGVVGVFVGLVVFIATIIPFVGYINLASGMTLSVGEASVREIPKNIVSIETMSIETASEPVAEATKEETEGNAMSETIESLGQTFLQIHNDYLAPLADNFVIKSIHTCGGKWIFNTLTSAKVGEQKVYLANELDVVTKVYGESVALLKVEAKYYGPAQITAVNNITATLDTATVVPTVISGAVSYTSKTWLQGGEVFGFEKINVGDYYASTLDDLLEIFAGTTNDTIKQDIHTIGNLLNICIEQKGFVEIANGTPINIAKNPILMGNSLVELYKNDTTRPISIRLLNTFKKYIYRIYNDVNDTSVDCPPEIVVENLSEEIVRAEGERLASIVADFTAFYDSANMEEEDNTKFLIQTDVRSLGRALDTFEQSVFLGDSYRFLLSAVLKSEGASKFAFVTPDFVDAMLESNSSMEAVLVSRQQIAIMLSVAKGENKEESIKHILQNLDPESAAVIKETLTPDVLIQFGMNQEQSNSMSATLDSVIDQIVDNEDGFTDEEFEKEVSAVDNIVNVVKNATSNNEEEEGYNLFSANENEYSKSGVTIDEFVDTVVNSQVVSNAVISSSKDEEGNTVENPYGISDSLTEYDKENAKISIENYYNNNQIEGEENTELKEKLGSLANILGVDVTLE